jgi:heterotetrameric sarcosine oxidase gamma subunit
MSRSPLTPRSGLERVPAMHRHAVRDGRAGVTLALRSGPALATVSVRKNQLDALVSRVRDVVGLELSQVRKCAIAGPIAFVWAGPGHWLARADGEDGAALEQRLRATFGNLASVCDQSDGRTVIRVGGERARDVLAKGVPIDLHPRAFRVGDAAVTSVAHISVQFWQVDETPTYEFIVSRSFAVGFWEWLTDSAAEFGYLIADEGD